jgi:hypothetical protein
MPNSLLIQRRQVFSPSMGMMELSKDLCTTPCLNAKIRYSTLSYPTYCPWWAASLGRGRRQLNGKVEDL